MIKRKMNEEHGEVNLSRDNDDVICSEQWLSSQDSTTLLKVYKWTPKHSKPLAEVLIVHGYLEHAFRYKDVAEALCRGHHIAVTVFDVRGHGHSKTWKKSPLHAADPESICHDEYPRGYIADWKDYVDDLETVQSTMHPGLPHFLYGHSNGGLIVVYYWMLCLQNSKPVSFQGILLSSPFLQPAQKIPWFKKQAANMLGPYFGKVLTVPTDLQASDVTSCPQKQKEHINDILIFDDASLAWAWQVQKVQKIVLDYIFSNTSENLRDTKKTPLWFAYGTDDTVADPQKNKSVAERLSSSFGGCLDVTIVSRMNERHELLNEVRRTELYDEIGNWIAAISK